MRKTWLYLVVLALFVTASLAYAGGGNYPPISVSLAGKTLAFAAVPPGSVSPTPQVYLWQYTREPVQITHSQYSVTHPRFSPDSRELAVNDGNRVAVIDLVSGREKILVPGPRKFLGDWSPDGRFLCYTSFTWVPEWDDFFFPRTWYLDTKTKKYFQVPDNGGDQRNPTYGPDGTIAYEDWTDGTPVVIGYNPTTGEESVLVGLDENGHGARYPVWSADGGLHYSNYPPYTDSSKIFFVVRNELPGRGIPETHNLWQWGEDTPEAATPEGDFLYYSAGSSIYTTYHIMRDRFGTLWALDHIIGMNYWCGSIAVTETQPVHLRYWKGRTLRIPEPVPNRTRFFLHSR